MAKQSFAEFSEQKRKKESVAVNGKTFAEFAAEKRQKAAAEDYNVNLVPRSADYLDLTNDISLMARNAPVEQRKREIEEEAAAEKYGTTVIPRSADYLDTTNKLMDLALETVDNRAGVSRVAPGMPGGGGRGYSTVANLDPSTATPGDYMAAIARDQQRTYADMVTPDNSPLEVQRRETNRAFRTANAFMPLENQPLEAWDTYNKLYDEAVKEDEKLREMGGRAARELPVTLPKSFAAGTLGAVRGLVNEAGYFAQGATKAQMDENAEMWRRMGREDYAQDMEAVKDAQGGFQNWANFGQNYISSAAEAAAGYGKTGQALSNVAQGVGGMVPSIVSNLAVPGSGLPVMFFQASGNATEEAKAAGASDEAAAVYGTAVGAVEVLTEKMFGGIPGLNIGALDDALEAAVKRGVGSEAAQRAILFLLDALGEGVEEFTSEFGDYFLDKWLLKNDDRTIDEVGKDAMYSFLIGALTSIAMQAPVEVANMAKTSQGRKQLAQIVADQVDRQMATEQTVAPQAEPAQQPITQKQQAGNEQINDPLMRLAQEMANEEVARAEPAADEVPLTGADGLRNVIRQAQSLTESGEMTPGGIEALVNNYDESADAAAYISGMRAAYSAGANGADIKTVKNTGLSSTQIKAAYDAGKAARPQNHIDNRNMTDVGKTNVNAFQFDHPQLHRYFADAAKILKNDLANSSENRGWMHSNQRGDNGKKIGRYYYQQTSTLLEDAKRQGYSLPEISDALDRIINNHGQENVAVAKRVELLLDQMMTNGYTTSFGQEIAPNSEYIQAKGVLPGGMSEAEARIRQYDQQYELSDALEPPTDAELARREAERAAIRQQYAPKTQQQSAPAAQEQTARAAKPTTPARETPSQTQKTPAVRAENPGLVRDENAAKAKLTRRESRALDALGKVLGKKIQFVDTIAAEITDEDGNVKRSGANAELDGDTIRIALDSDDPFLTAAVHEVVHGIRDLDEASYQVLAKFVANNMSEEHRAIAEWEQEHKGYTADQIPEEIVCDAFGRMLGDEAKLRQLVQDDRNVAQKLFDALHDLLVKVQRALSGGQQKLTDNQRAVYSELEDRIETMLSLFDEALHNVSGAEGAAQSAEAKHSLKSTMATLNLHDEMRDGKRVWVDENGNVITRITPKMVRSTGVGALIDIASQEWKDDSGNVIKTASISPKEADKQVAEKASQRFVERAQGKRYSLKEGTDNSAQDLAESQRKNYDYNQQQTETGSTLRTLGKPGKNGSPIKRSKYGVGKEIGGTVYFHRDYVDDVIPSDVYETALQALQENYPDFQFNCVEYNPKDNTVRFDEAPGFDTEREPVVGDYVRVKADGTTEKGHTDYIWHHKWLWVKDDYTGFNVRDAWEWSKQWLSTISGKTYNVNGKPYNDNAVSDGNGISRWNAQLDAYGLPRDGAAGNGRGKRYSLKTVPPVQPSSDAWQRGHDEAWFVQNGYPIYRDVAADQLAANEETGQDKRGGKHGSQITSTISTYQQVYDTIKAEHPDDWQDLRILDASSGIGLGTRVGREMGFNVTDIEPYPSKTGYQFDKKRDNAETWTVRHPDYEDYSKLEDLVADGKVEGYDYIISNAVLNVIPQDTRDELVVAMGHLLNPGGQMFVNVISRNYQGAIDSLPEVRKNDKGIPVGAVRTAEGDYSESGNIKGRGHETFVWKTNTVQKVFSYNELIAYLRDALGDGYTVEPFTKYGMTAAMVTKDANHKYSRSGRDVLDEYVEQYGEIKRGEKPARDFSMPKRTAPKTKVSMTARTVAEAGATPESFVPTIENLAANHEFDYTPYSDKKAISNAELTAAEKGWSATLTDWVKDVSRGEVSKTNTAIGWALYNNAVNSGDTETALLVLRNIVAHQRNAAQAVQATRILKQLDPQTQLYNAEKTVEGLKSELKKRYGKDVPDLEIDEDLADKFLREKTPEGRAKVMSEIYKDIGRQMPTRFIDRWNAWRYLAMLGNPRTHIRNIVGNAGFAPVVAAKNLTATAIESAVNLVSGGKLERTKGNIIGRGDLMKAAWTDYENVRSEALGEGKYNDSAMAKKEIQEGRRIFGNTKSKAWNKTGGAALEWARRANGTALDAEDVWFSKPHYTMALAQYCAANNISAEQISKGEGLAKAREYAIKEAQKATYRDTNDFSQAISRLGRGAQWSQNKVTRAISTVIEGILPFRKTPANILARGVEYSPLGLMKSLTYDLAQVRKGEMSGADMIDHISAGLTGTGLMALGAYLVSQGILGVKLRGRGGGDDKKRAFEKLEGHQDYALELPDGTSITLDWLAPEALPMFVGANLAEIAKENNGDMKLADILTAIGNVTEPMLEMSCLQSLNNVFEAVGYAKEGDMNALTSALASAATSYLTQALPTLLGQVERTGESKRMTTYTDKNDFLTGDIQYTLGKASAKIPVWDYKQIPYIDAWGREELTGKTIGGRAAQNFFNPAYLHRITESDTEKELVRLYDTTGEAGVFPQRAKKYFNVDGERKDLTAGEYIRYATEKGRTSYAVVGGMVNSDLYKQLSDSEKAGMIKDAYTYADQIAKTTVGGTIPGSYAWVKKAQTGVSKGIKPETFILARNSVSDVEGVKDKNGNTISNSAGLKKMQIIYSIPGLSYDQRKYLFECFGVGKTIIGYNKALVDQKLSDMKKK